MTESDRQAYEGLTNQFIRGFVAAGILSSIGGNKPKMIIKNSLQGGIALAAGYSAAQAVSGKMYGRAALSAGSGVLGVVLIEMMLKKNETMPVPGRE